MTPNLPKAMKVGSVSHHLLGFCVRRVRNVPFSEQSPWALQMMGFTVTCPLLPVSFWWLYKALPCGVCVTAHAAESLQLSGIGAGHLGCWLTDCSLKIKTRHGGNQLVQKRKIFVC